MASNGFWEEKEACVDASCIFFDFFCYTTSMRLI